MCSAFWVPAIGMYIHSFTNLFMYAHPHPDRHVSQSTCREVKNCHQDTKEEIP